MDDPKIIAIIQARMGSSRLPGKIVMPFLGQPILAHVINRTAQVKAITSVIVALPDEAASLPAEQVAQQAGARVFLGSESDVLARYYGAFKADAERTGQAADYIIRITADCPLISPDVLAGMIAGFLKSGTSYGGITGFPHGLDCEIFSQQALIDAHTKATSAPDREHVTLWMKREMDAPYLLKSDEATTAKDQRWVVDYAADYQFFQALEASPIAGSLDTMSWQDLAQWLNKNPAIKQLNKAAAEDWDKKNQAIYEAATEAATEAASKP